MFWDTLKECYEEICTYGPNIEEVKAAMPANKTWENVGQSRMEMYVLQIGKKRFGIYEMGSGKNTRFGVMPLFRVALPRHRP